MIRFAAIASFGLLLAACGQASTAYPPQYETTFMQACEAQSSVAGVCACTWDRIEAEIPVNDFVALERLPGPQRDTHPLMEQIRGYSLACQAQVTTGSTEPAPAP